MARRRVILRNGAVAAALLLALVSGGAPWSGTLWRAAAHAAAVSEASTELAKYSPELLAKLGRALKAAGQLLKDELVKEGSRETVVHLEHAIRNYLRDFWRDKRGKVPKDAHVAFLKRFREVNDASAQEESAEAGPGRQSGKSENRLKIDHLLDEAVCELIQKGTVDRTPCEHSTPSPLRRVPPALPSGAAKP